MDLLGGYGSDADSDGGDEAVAAPQAAGSTLWHLTTVHAVSRARQQHIPHNNVSRVASDDRSAAAGELASANVEDASLGSGSLLSKLPAPKKKKRPILLTVLAEPIPDSDSDVSPSPLSPSLTVPCHLPSLQHAAYASACAYHLAGAEGSIASTVSREAAEQEDEA